MPPGERDPCDPARVWRCGTAARWLPRVLAAAVLLAALLAAARLAQAPQSSIRLARHLVVLCGAVLALGLVRQGGELRLEVSLEGRELVLRRDAASWSVSLDDVETLRWAPPLARRGLWLPAAALSDAGGRSWRISALLEDGGALVDALLARAERHDLGAWAETLALRRRMDRAGTITLAGYTVGAAIVTAALGFYLR